MLVSLTVGKVDAGVAVLLTEDKRLIEFPSILLPPDISSGSIVDITVSRNAQSEAAAAQAFQSLQSKIYNTFGQRTPEAPVLRCRNATQTSVVLEWDPIQLATAELRSLSLYRNGSKAGSIPRPLDMQSTKISGLAVDTEYTFHLVLRTSAGTYHSEKLSVRTHKMTELSGITVTPGVMPAQLKESLATTINRIGAKMIDQVRIDTTHFVCTEGRGPAWEKAVEMNIPIVVPDWVKGCEREGRIVGVRQYYINADPRLRQVGPSTGQQQQQQQQQQQSNLPSHGRSQSSQLQSSQARSPHMQSPRTEITPPTPEQVRHQRASSAAAAAIHQNGRPSAESEDAAPPPPPPKDESPGKTDDAAAEATSEGEGKSSGEAEAEAEAEARAEEEAHAVAAAADAAEKEHQQQQEAEEGGQPHDDDDEEDDEHSDDGTEKGDAENDKRIEASFPNTPGFRDDGLPLPSPSDAGSFQDVAL